MEVPATTTIAFLPSSLPLIFLSLFLEIGKGVCLVFLLLFP